MIQNRHHSPDDSYALSPPDPIEQELPFQLVGAGRNFLQNPIERPFGFRHYQWIQGIRGSGVVELNGRAHPLNAYTGLLLHPEEPHAYRSAEGEWRIHWISFNGHDVRRFLRYIGMDRSGLYRIRRPEAPAARIARSVNLLKSGNPHKGIDGSGIVYSLLLDLMKYVDAEAEVSRPAHEGRLKPALDLMEEALDRVIPLEEMASAAGVTPQYFCELFRKVMRQRPGEYLNARRIERAKEILLKEPGARMADVARRSGFGNDSYFSRVFKNREGLSPREYRRIKLD